MDLNDLVSKVGIRSDENPNNAIKTYSDNNTKNLEKLEYLIAAFSRVAKSAIGDDARINRYYNYVYKSIRADYTLNDIETFASYLEIYERLNYAANDWKFGLFISAAINKVIKKGEKVHIISPKPLDNLFYNLKDTEAYVNTAGNNFGGYATRCNISLNVAKNYVGNYMDNSELRAKKVGDYLGSESKNNCRIYVEKAGDFAGYFMDNSVLQAKKVGDRIGYNSKNNCHIAVEEAGNFAAGHMDNSELRAKKVGDYLGHNSKNNCRIYVEKAGDFAGYFMDNSELRAEKVRDNLGHGSKNSKIYVDKARDYAGDHMDNSELRAKKVGDYLGYNSNNCKIHAEEAGDLAGLGLTDSELYIDRLNGSLALSCLKGNNRIYLGEYSYMQHPEYRNRGVQIWWKKT